MSTSKVLTLRAGSGELACRIGLRVGPIDRPGCGGRLPAAGCGDHSCVAEGWPSLAVPALCRQLLPQCGKGLLLCSLHGHGADLQPRGGLPEREALEDGEPQGCRLGSGQLIDQLLQRQLLPRPAGSQLRLRRSQLLELNGEANNFADGGVPSLGRHRLLTHNPQTTDPTLPAPAAGCGTRRTGESRCS